MQDLRRLRYTVENFTSLQGLRGVPIGLMFIINIWLQRPHGWDIGIAGLALLLGFGASFAIGRYYYRARYGFLRSRAQGGWVFLGFALFWAGSWVDVRHPLPVSMVGLAIAAWFVFIWARAPDLRWHYGVAALALIATSVLPAFGISDPIALWGQHSRVGWTLLGVTMIACGILDHLLLRELLPPAPQEGTLEHSV
jgi:hypothetical protein